MNDILLAVGMLALAVGAAGLAVTLVRFAGARIPGWKAAVYGLYSAGIVTVGFYLVLDIVALLPVWIALVSAAALYEARKRKESGEDVSTAA